jgi:hypothetical protein
MWETAIRCRNRRTPVTLAPLLHAGPATQVHAFAAMDAFLLGAGATRSAEGNRSAPEHRSVVGPAGQCIAPRLERLVRCDKGIEKRLLLATHEDLGGGGPPGRTGARRPKGASQTIVSSRRSKTWPAARESTKAGAGTPTPLAAGPRSSVTPAGSRVHSSIALSARNASAAFPTRLPHSSSSLRQTVAEAPTPWASALRSSQMSPEPSAPSTGSETKERL